MDYTMSFNHPGPFLMGLQDLCLTVLPYEGSEGGFTKRFWGTVMTCTSLCTGVLEGAGNDLGYYWRTHTDLRQRKVCCLSAAMLYPFLPFLVDKSGEPAPAAKQILWPSHLACNTSRSV